MNGPRGVRELMRGTFMRAAHQNGDFAQGQRPKQRRVQPRRDEFDPQFVKVQSLGGCVGGAFPTSPGVTLGMELATALAMASSI